LHGQGKAYLSLFFRNKKVCLRKIQCQHKLL
jgi:hypothetical protein